MHNKNYSQGQILVVALLFLTVILLTTLTIFSLVSFFIRNATIGYLQEQATNLAEAGVDKAVQSLNDQGSSYTGEVNTSLGAGTFTTTISDVSFGVKEIISTGFIPNSTKTQSKKTVKVKITTGTQSIAFHYAVQIGSGGLDMANSALIHGNVYTTGNITGSGSSKIDGDAFSWGTISSPDPTVTGKKVLCPNPTDCPNQADFPTIDNNWLTDQKNTASQNTVTCNPTCTISSDTNIGPAKYVGNLEITKNAIVTMNGPIWVAKDSLGNGGNFSMKQGGTTLKLNQSFGSLGAALIVDGVVDLSQGGNLQPTSSSPKGYILVITNSTSSQAVKISQSGATAVFYALNGGATLNQTANVSALVSKSLSMSQNSELTYEQGLASASFTSGPGGAWQIAPGTYR